MQEFVLSHEAQLRLFAFVGVLGLMVVFEWTFPRKQRALSRTKRWTTNALIIVVDTIVLRLTMPIVAVGMAMWATANGWGLFNHIGLPLWFEALLAIILMDLAIYGQHVATHKIPLLWAFHKVHHADRDIDATTGVRFHPVEIIYSMAYKLLVVLIIGPAAFAVILFEIILNASAMFNHANVRLSFAMDALIRKVVVTPDMHRVHHSVYREEHDRNYGFCLSIWDQIFKTYTAQPRDGHDSMVIGLSDHQNDAPATLKWSMFIPFRKINVRKAP